MKYFGRVFAAVGLLCLVDLPTVGAQALLDASEQVQLVADAAVAGDPIPAAQTFTISQSGSYQVTLTDLQFPKPLASLSLAIANSIGTAVVLSAAGQQTVTLQAGTYTAQVLALAAPQTVGGSFGVQVSPVGGGTAWQYNDAVTAANPAPSSGQSILSTKFSVSTAGTYQLAVTDLQFPVALSSLNLIVLNDCGTTPGCTTTVVTTQVGPAISASLNLAAGSYDMFVVASANSNPGGTVKQGLYSIQIAAGSPSAAVYADTVPVGQLSALSAIPVAVAGAVSLQLTDLATPASLASIQALVTQGASVLGQLTGAGSASLAAGVGTMQLYVAAQPGGTSGQGAFEAYLTQANAAPGATVLADIAQPVLAVGAFAYAYPVTLSTSGNYQSGIYDFQAPTAFSALSAVVAQAGVVLASTQSSSGLFMAAAGPVTVLVFPTLSSATANSLFGVQLVAAAGATVFEATQGVGALFSSQTFTVPSAGSYDLTLTDLGFPTKFAALTVIATRGYSLAGQTTSGKTLTFNATPGTYVLNVFAQVGSGADYGLYGVNVWPSPTVTLTASADSVMAAGQANLTWSSSNTTGCTASASPSNAGWTGSLADSGAQTTGALSATTTFSISCVGQSGTTATATAVVAVTAAPAPASKGKGGGGAFGPQTLLLLAWAMIWQAARRRLTAPRYSP